MALFVKEDKTQKSDDVLGTATSSVSGLNSSNPRDVQAHLGQGSRVEGKLTFEGSVRIDGHVEGEISAQDSVIIGEGAEVTAQIHANTVVVQGRVVGDITARKRVELKAPASVVGNISTPTFVVHEGVVFEGIAPWVARLRTARNAATSASHRSRPRNGRGSPPIVRGGRLKRPARSILSHHDNSS